MPEQYALITGAGTGFGKALAIEAARRGYHLFLVALPGENLPCLAAQLHRQYGVKALAMETDLCEEGSCEAVWRQVQHAQFPVSLLINNAGVGSTGFFADGSLAGYERQIRLNVLATTRLTHLFLPMLAQNQPSFILNVGSLASFFSLQKKQVYAATKSFVFSFSKSLRREVKSKGISVSVVCPGGMYTNRIARETLATGNLLSRRSAMHPEAVAPLALNGLLRKKEVIVPGKINWTLVFLDRFVPRVIVRYLEELTMRPLQAPGLPAAGDTPVYERALRHENQLSS